MRPWHARCKRSLSPGLRTLITHGNWKLVWNAGILCAHAQERRTHISGAVQSHNLPMHSRGTFCPWTQKISKNTNSIYYNIDEFVVFASVHVVHSNLKHQHIHACSRVLSWDAHFQSFLATCKRLLHGKASLLFLANPLQGPLMLILMEHVCMHLTRAMMTVAVPLQESMRLPVRWMQRRLFARSG
jgi:hypothetical protein